MKTTKSTPKHLLGLIMSLAMLVAFAALLAHSRSYTSPHLATNGQPSLDSKPSLPAPSVRAGVSEAYGKLPLSFESNDGQTDAQVRFVSRGPGYNLFLTPAETVLSLHKDSAQNKRDVSAKVKGMGKTQTVRRRDVLRMKLMGGNPTPQVTGRDEMPAKTNYFVGNDPAKWGAATNYARVEYQQVYPGVNLIYYGNQRQLEYDFVLAPGADPSSIRLAFSGAKRMHLDSNGDLILTTAGGNLRQHKPIIYQDVDGERKSVSGNYALKGRSEVGFDVGEYDSSKPLVIDPVLVYSTYIGGSEYDGGDGIAVDSAGNAYVVGTTYSDNFPKVNGYPTPLMGFYSIFVLKLNATGNALLYSAVLAGADGNLASGNGIAIDGAGRAYVTATTNSTNFPTKNAYQLFQGGGDAVVAKVDTTLTGTASLLYSTYLGGNDNDIAVGIAVDAAGHAYVAGDTSSSNFPTSNAFQARQSRRDVFVTKLDTNAAGSASLLYSTYLGGVGEAFSDGDDYAGGIAADASGNVYVTGNTTSFHFPTKNAYQGFMAGPGFVYDAFVTRLNTNVSGAASLVYSTYIGGNGYVEKGFGIACDSTGIAYVTGFTTSPNFPVKNAFQATKNSGFDVFVTKFDTNSGGANSLLYSTFLGGSANDNDSEFGTAIAADSSGSVYITGRTFSTDFPTKNSLQAHRGGWCDYTISPCSDVFVAKLNTTAAGSAGLVYSTFLGGALHDQGRGIAIDSAGSAYITGFTDSSDFPANNSDPDTDHIASDTDLFVAKISDLTTPPPPDADNDGVPDSSDLCPGTPAGTPVDPNGCPASCTSPPSGLVGWWRGEGNALDTQGSNHGSLGGNTTFAAGKAGQGFKFDPTDGSADYVSIPDSPAHKPANISVEAWVRFDALDTPSAFFTGGQYIVFKKNSRPSDFYEGYTLVKYRDASGDRISFGIASAGGVQKFAVSPPTIVAGQFYHVVGTYDFNGSSGTMKLYLNGVLSGSIAASFPIDYGTRPLFIGGHPEGGTANLQGVVDEVSIYNRALSATEIFALYNAGSAGKCRNRPLVAVCQNVTVSAGADCTASASINNGSSDPDGDAITITQSPAGPYPLGNTTVMLTVTDSKGASTSCAAIVTVVDSTQPTITAPPAVNVSTGPSATACGAVVSDATLGSATANDNCGSATVTRSGVPAGNFFPVGTTVITYIANDGHGNTATATQTVTVTDTTPPAITAPPTVNATTGAGATVCGGVISDATLGSATAFDYCTVTVTRSGVPAGNVFPVGTTVITYTATDGNSNTATATQQVIVTDNTAPTITAPPAVNASTGAGATACGMVVSDAALGTAMASDNCGSAMITRNGVPAGNLFPVGTTVVTYTADDGHGNTATATQTVTVIDNTPPAISACATAQSVFADASCQAAVPDFTGGVATSDNCGSVTVTQSPAAGTFVGTGTTSITLIVMDAAGNNSTCTTSFTVADKIPPSITAPPNVNAYTGAAATTCGVVIGDAALGAATANDACSGVTIARGGVPAGNFFPVGMTTITYIARDASGNTAMATQQVTVVDNAPPVIACPANISAAGNIAGSCAATVNPGTAAATDNCAGVTIAGVRSDGQPLNASYPLGTTTITWKATDMAGNQSTCQQTVTVTNPAPVATITSPATGALYAVNTPISFTGGFTDNAGGTHTATWTLDTFTQAGLVNETTQAVSATYSFTTPGVYRIKLTVADGCGGESTTDQVDGLTAIIVIYDPNGGWVSGGGWINSPAGAYADNPSLTGKANFAFQSKYQTGAGIPDGKTEFQFKVANLDFGSTSYEWLVVSGARAQYKGVGTINGAGNYGFLLTAIDGQVNGGGGLDKFRIKIWDRNNGDAIVYDNQMGAGDDVTPSTALGGGSIVIHR